MSENTLVIPRDKRYETEPRRSDDCRSEYQRDADRIIFSAEFQRLGGITQVASVQNTSSRHHNRLTHTIEVATIGRRIAERLIHNQKDLAKHWELDPDVVSAACYAHDIGHPPFGHVAEDELNELSGNFEGNAQSFRIVVSLACHHHGKKGGLNLTAAVLNGILKYPWTKSATRKKKRKWCIYEGDVEQKAFERLRGEAKPDERKSVEADIMDWADDIAYSVSDLTDFFRMGIIPIDRFDRIEDQTEMWQGIRDWKQDELVKFGEYSNDHDRNQAIDKFINEMRGAFPGLKNTLGAINRPFSGRPTDHRALSGIMRALISHYMEKISLVEPNDTKWGFTKIDNDAKTQVSLLKAITRHYVIRHSALATQQVGFRRIIRGLYEALIEILGKSSQHYAIPISTRDDPDFTQSMKDNEELRKRKACDIIAGLGEAQAIEFYHRLHGIDPGISLEGPIR